MWNKVIPERVEVGAHFEIEKEAKRELVWTLAQRILEKATRDRLPILYYAFQILNLASWALAEEACVRGLRLLRQGEAPKRGKASVSVREVACLALAVREAEEAEEGGVCPACGYPLDHVPTPWVEHRAKWGEWPCGGHPAWHEGEGD